MVLDEEDDLSDFLSLSSGLLDLDVEDLPDLDFWPNLSGLSSFVVLSFSLPFSLVDLATGFGGTGLGLGGDGGGGSWPPCCCTNYYKLSDKKTRKAVTRTSAYNLACSFSFSLAFCLSIPKIAVTWVGN